MANVATALLLLAPASLAAAENYTAHAGLNCYQGHGGVNIDSGAAPGALTLDACLAHCDSTPACECVVRGAGDKATQCWRRSACDPAECLPEASMDTYIKPGDAPSAKCEAAMEQLCGVAKKAGGAGKCISCLGAHSSALRAAGCSGAATAEVFCKGGGGQQHSYPDRRPPGPACKGCPNLVFSITDDQDALLGGWEPERQSGPRPYLGVQAEIAAKGVTMGQWRIHTPICSPSRSELVSSRYYHNVKNVGLPVPVNSRIIYAGTEHVNGSLYDNHSFGVYMRREKGYQIAIFGKANFNSETHTPIAQCFTELNRVVSCAQRTKASIAGSKGLR